jgi:hypothetical protein
MSDVIATFTSNKGEFEFNAVAFGDAMIKAGKANKTQVRAMVSELRRFYQPQAVTVELIAKKLWVEVVAKSGDGYSFNIGSRGKASSPCLLF